MRVGFRILLITDRRQARGGNLETTVEAALAGGIRGVMLRENVITSYSIHYTKLYEAEAMALAHDLGHTCFGPRDFTCPATA